MDVELQDIDEIELSLTVAPAIKEKFIMVKKEFEEAEWTAAFINDLPDSSFAYIEPGGTKDGEGKTTPRSLRHLPYKDGSGKVDAPHVRNALSRLPQTNISAAAEETARRKLMAAASAAGVKAASEEELKAEFEKLDEDARYAMFLKAKDAEAKAQHMMDDENLDEEGKPKKKAPPEFNFDKADEPTKTALRAIGEALTNIAGVPEPVAEFAKSIKTKLPSGQKSGDELVAFAKSAFPGLVEAIQQPLQERLSVVEKTAEELQGEKELAEMRALAADLPGDVEIVAKRLVGFKKSMTPEDFEAYITEQKGLKEQVSKSELFGRVSSGQPGAGSAEAIVMSKAQAIVAKSEFGIKDMAAAIEHVGKSDPILWGQYQEEVRNRPSSLRAA